MPRASARHIVALEATIHAIPVARVLFGTRWMSVAS